MPIANINGNKINYVDTGGNNPVIIFSHGFFLNLTSFVYRARAPFDPKKIHSFFNQEWPGVIRAKGFFWLSS